MVGGLARLPGPWRKSLLLALALLVVPILAWWVIPRASHEPSAAASSGAVPAEAGPADSADVQGPTRVVKGRVTADGEPVAGARVVMRRGAATVGSKSTNALGEFELLASHDELSLTASHPKHGSATESVPAGEEVFEAELALSGAGGGAVSGTVVDGDGNGVARAHVSCEGDDGRNGATTDKSGRFTLSPESAGCQAFATHPSHGNSELVTLVAGGKNVLTLASPGKIAGLVVDEQGHALNAAIVAVESFIPPSGQTDGPFYKQQKVNEQGEFELSELAPGSYVLSASAPGRPPQKTRTIEVGSGKRSRGITITLSKGGSLSGSVTDRDTGAGIAGVRVSLDAVTTSGASATGGAETDADGQYTLEGVPQGPFSVRFRHNEYTARILTLDGSSGGQLTANVDLAKGSGRDMEMTGIGATLMKGSKFVEVASVLDDGPAKAAGMQVGDRIERIEGRSAEGFTVPDCVQRLRGPEGTRVSVTLGRGDKRLELTITRAKIVR